MTTENQAPEQNEQQAELMNLINQLYQHSLAALKNGFEECAVDGQVLGHETFGPLFVFHVRPDESRVYSCGFFLNELLGKFQKNADPALYLSSYFVDLMESPESRPLPNPPQTDDEAKALIDGAILPRCLSVVREEFAPEDVHFQLDFNEQHGPVVEVGFASITDGNNVCAVPIPILMMHHLLNRDPADLLVNGLYRIREEHGIS